MVIYDKFISIKPRPYPGVKRNDRTGEFYTPEWYKDYKNELRRAVQATYQSNVFPPIFAVELKFFLNTPKYTSKNAGDVDNLSKAVLDALQGVIWLNDAQIIQLIISKYPSLKPGIYIYVQSFAKS